MPKKIIVIGAGFAGIAAATCLADKGYDVTILEKNDTPGGRCRKFEAEGFTFDMGPSWYWMPDIFEQYFGLFGKKPSDYYDLIRLDPSYCIYFGKDDVMNVPANMSELEAMFESYEKGSSQNLRKFLNEAEYKYEVGINEMVFKPSHSIFEFADLRIVKAMFRLQMFQNMSSHVRKLFKNQKLIELLEFPVLFLGATPENTPAMYSLMNYADLALGTWYPKGGMYKIIEGMVALAEEKGVKFKYNQPVTSITVPNGHASEVITPTDSYIVDAVVAGADYHHIDQEVLAPKNRQYSEKYWDKRTMAPSSLLFYLGVNKKLDNLLHHNLFFDKDFKQHAHEIYEDAQWPSDPLFYVCVTSKTDDSAAPEGCENVFVLVPLAPDLEDTEELREKYYHMVMDRLEDLTGQTVRDSVIYKRSYAHKDFKADYNAFKGNAYGLANTLMQTAFLKPKLKHKKISNLYFTGQLTTPGPGVPPSLISGQVVANELYKEMKP
ncbi:MAG: phytoene desaturase family protein [Saprospiraceae bacterium]